LEVDGRPLDGVTLHAGGPDKVELLVDGVLRRYSVHLAGDTAYVDSNSGSVTLRELPRFPRAHHGAAEGSLTAPMPGTIVRIAVSEGDHVEAGQVLLVMEAMKMEHQIIAASAGVVAKVAVEVGNAVDADAVLVVIEAADEAADEEAEGAADT
jgi:propionyl-CoA carboxylase alpha chain